MENFKRSVKRFVTRLTILGLVVICGAIAIAQANKDRTIANAAGPNLPESQEPVFEAAPIQITNVGASSSPQASAPQTSALQAPSVQADQRTSEDQPAAPLKEDNNVALAQFSEPAADESATSEPAASEQFQAVPAIALVAGTDDAAQHRFTNDDVANSQDNESTSQDPATVGFAGAPELLNDQQLPPSAIDSPLPPAETGVEAFAAGTQSADSAAAGGGSRFNQPPSTFEQPPTEPRFSQDAATEVVDTPVGAAAGGRFGLPATSGNRLRSDSGSSVREPAPLTTAPPTFDGTDSGLAADAFSAPPAGEPAAELPEPAYARNSVSISGAGKPGARELEGPQTPSVTIQKIAPSDVRVGEPVTFEIRVRNNGQIPAEQILIRDEVPYGTELVDTNPQATADSQGGLLWEVGTLRPGEDYSVSMQVTPLEEGTIGSVASLTMQTLASAKAEAKKPMLRIEHVTESQVQAGDSVKFTITIENPGSGSAENVVIEEAVPPGLSHSKGPKLEYGIGTIPAGGRRRLELTLNATEAGMIENRIVARADGGLVAEHSVNLEVVAPQLQIKIEGPSRRYLDRPATFSVAIENPGTADARSVQLACRLPQGLKFVSTNNSGRFDPTTNTIRWSLDRLPARQFGEVKFTATPVQKGDHNINAEATGAKGLKDSKDHSLAVQGIAALLFEVADQVDPIEVGGVTTYQIRVQNQGTEEATNVRFVALVPPGLKPIAARGRTKYQIEGNRILFDSIARLPAKGESIYSVRVEGVQAGDQRFKVQMTSDETKTPVVEEESTRVYAD